MPEVLTEVDGEWATGDYGDFLELTTEERAIVESRAERSRLEGQVIEAALRQRRSALALEKFWYEQDENAPHAAMEIYELSGEDIQARAAFNAATDALIEFESSQQHIKK